MSDSLEDLIGQDPELLSPEDDFDQVEDDSKRPENRYWFRANGQTLSIPLLKFLPVESALAFEEGRNVTGLLIGADTPEAAEFIRGLKGTAFRQFMARWEALSKVTPGESRASSASSASIGKQSSTTS